jgi:uncharacterized protein (DUF924 family)
MTSAEEVLKFWLEDVGEAAWYRAPEGLDGDIRARFAGVWEVAASGGLLDWQDTAPGALAYIILTDQFPRNMFRGTARAFATDPLALTAARSAVDAGFDMTVEPPARQFFYMPFEHSEAMADQDRAVELMRARMRSDPEMELHARAHREIVARFGRFPFRNAALGRASTPGESEFLDTGGYSAIVEALKAGHDGSA